MMYNNYQNYQNPMNVGYNPGQYRQGYFQQPVTPARKISSTLSQDEIQHIKNKTNPMITIKPTDDEVIQGKCNHHEADGSYALKPLNPEAPNNGLRKCRICGTIIDFNDVNSQEEADEITKRFTNLQEIVKCSNTSMPLDLVAQYYSNTIPYNKKMGILYRQATIDINKIENGYTSRIGNNTQGAYVYSVLNGGYAAGAPMNQYSAGQMQPGIPINQFNPVQQQPIYNTVSFQPQQMQQPVGTNPLYAEPQQLYGQPNGYYETQHQNTNSQAERIKQLEEENKKLREMSGKEQTVRTSQA